jgi:hypothetical protein
LAVRLPREKVTDATGTWYREVSESVPLTLEQENAKLRELVEELLVVYYHQDDARIDQLRAELDI